MQTKMLSHEKNDKPSRPLNSHKLNFQELHNHNLTIDCMSKLVNIQRAIKAARCS